MQRLWTRADQTPCLSTLTFQTLSTQHHVAHSSEHHFAAGPVIAIYHFHWSAGVEWSMSAVRLHSWHWPTRSKPMRRTSTSRPRPRTRSLRPRLRNCAWRTPTLSTGSSSFRGLHSLQSTCHNPALLIDSLAEFCRRLKTPLFKLEFRYQHFRFRHSSSSSSSVFL